MKYDREDTLRRVREGYTLYEWNRACPHCRQTMVTITPAVTSAYESSTTIAFCCGKAVRIMPITDFRVFASDAEQGDWGEEEFLK